MKDLSKTNQEQLDKIAALKQRIQELEIFEAEHQQMEKARRASELRYQTIFETTGTTMLIVEEDMTISLANDRWGTLTGYTREEVEGKRKWTEFIVEDDLNDMIIQHKLRRVDPGFATKSYEFRLIHRDGYIKHILLTVDLIPGTRKSVASLMDITERKLAEEAQRESEALLRIYLNNAPDGIYTTDMKGYFLYGNRKCEEITGYKKVELIGKNFLKLNLLSKQDLKKAAHLIQASSEGMSTGPDELELIRKDGRIIPVEINTAVVQRSDKGIVLGFVRDITERREAEASITRERQKLKTLSDNAPFGMVLIDVEGHFTYINRKFTELFSYDLPDLPDGRTWFRKAYPNIEYRHTVISTWREDWANAKPGTSTLRVFGVTCKDGTEKVVNFATSFLVSGDYLMTCEDITEMRKLESQLRQGQKMEAIGTLAGGIAHDFNNILTALTGYAGLIQKKMDTSDPLRPYVEQILVASQKAGDLIQSLLAFSRQQPFDLTPLDMNNTIRTMEKLLGRLLTEDIKLRTSLADDDTIVMADKSQMDQIFFNLVSNARDAMPKGGTLIIETAAAVIDAAFIKIHGFGKKGKYIEITISDTGMGMDEPTKGKIFDPFFTTKEAGKGTGLGLATVYGIVKQHGGYITVESEPDQGTTFSIYFPSVKMKVNEEQDRTTPIIKGNETILIADDDNEVRHLVWEALQAYGYSTIEATDGEDAIDKYKQNRPIDLVVLDVVMPKKNGREVYQEIRGIDPHVKVLFTSGYTRDIVFDKGIESGEFDFMAKPLLFDELLQKIREMLDRQEVPA
jgi:two-component system, cell cycle sensor histidine kinase and response regulator CckA